MTLRSTKNGMSVIVGAGLADGGHRPLGEAAMKTVHEISRRRVLGLAMAASGLALAGGPRPVLAQGFKRTPSEILGPFYPVLRSMEKRADLTSLPG